MLDSQRSQMRIGGEVTASPHRQQQFAQYTEVARTGVNDRRGWLIQPGSDEIESDFNGQRIAE
jgi:hypothetical protein